MANTLPISTRVLKAKSSSCDGACRGMGVRPIPPLAAAIAARPKFMKTWKYSERTDGHDVASPALRGSRSAGLKRNGLGAIGHERDQGQGDPAAGRLCHGRGYDTYARIVAQHLGKQIAGYPTIIVQNMPGADGLTVANHVYARAAKDGSVIAVTNRNMAVAPALGLIEPQSVQYKAEEFTWLANLNTEVSVIIIRRDAKVNSIDDLRQRTVIVGSTGLTANNAIYPYVANNLLKTKFKVVTGYPGTSHLVLALERGEIEGIGGWARSIHPAAVAMRRRKASRPQGGAADHGVRQERRGPPGARADLRARSHGPAILRRRPASPPRSPRRYAPVSSACRRIGISRLRPKRPSSMFPSWRGRRCRISSNVLPPLTLGRGPGQDRYATGCNRDSGEGVSVSTPAPT